MYRSNETVQRMIEWLEQNLSGEPGLLPLSKYVGYSPWYCSALFHQICGMTLRSYVAKRRLTMAALALRDENSRILDVALDSGFSSQEAMSRAFKEAFGCTPREYRLNPRPLPLFLCKDVFHPWQYAEQRNETKHGEGGNEMSTKDLRDARMRVEYVPAHKYLGIWDNEAVCYGTFWERHSCDQVCGTVESMRHLSHPVVTPHTAGWHYVNGERHYFYGMGVPADYDGPVPEGFELREFPGSYYLVFYHPPFDYMEDNGEVMGRVEALAWSYDLSKEQVDPSGLSTAAGAGRFEWNENVCQCFQRHYPEGIGYEVLRPVKLR